MVAKIQFNNIPAELRQLKQWVCWQIEERDGKPTKVPKIAGTENSNASSTNPKTWTDFKKAYEYHNAGHFDGIGFVFTADDPYCGVYLDSCRDPKQGGTLKPWAKEIVTAQDSYSEQSQSGKGVHIIVKAKLPGTGRKLPLPGTDNEVEIYDRGRYFAMTGAKLKNYQAEIMERQDAILELYHRLKPESNHTEDKPTLIKQVSPALSDEEVIQMAGDAKNGAKFKRLMDGDSSGYTSESHADGSLAGILGFWTQDTSQILRIIAQSALWDGKWERPDYQQKTINGAVRKLNNFWRDGSTTQPRAATETQSEPTKSKPEQKAVLMPPSKFDMKALLPPAGFLRDYLEFQEPLSEAPGHLHIFAGLILLSSAIGKRVYFTVGMDQKYTNLWIVLNGGSGSKKSTAINAAGKVFNKAGFKDSRLPTQFTSEIMIEMLSKNPVGTFFWSEWGATMDQWGKTYAGDIMSILTDLYDSGYFSRWLRSDKYEIDGACLNMLCGCTPDWLKTVLDAKRAAMGFWPRFLFVPVGDPITYLPIPPIPDKDKLAGLSGRLRDISESIPDEYPQEADFGLVDGIYSRYYIESKGKAQKSGDNLQQAFTTRLLDYAKKIAILVELSRPDRESVAIQVSMESMEYTLKLVDWLEGTARFTITAATRSAMSELEEKILDYIGSKGEAGVLRGEITRRFRRDENRDVTFALDNLHNAELISIELTNTKRQGKRYFVFQ